jgi:uncharacterized Zn-binding protein involved in type VI secretion
MPEAARITDEISHTSALLGLLAGAVVGAAIGAAIVLTGGAAAGALAAAAVVGGGASLGSMIGEFAGSFLTSTTGAITGTCSPDVNIGGLLAARATADFSMCRGMIVSHPGSLIAQGSKTVAINGLPAARKTDKLVCGASISSGCETVFIGAEAGTFLDIDSEVPAWLAYAMMGVGLLSGVGALRLLGRLAWLQVGPVMVAGALGSLMGGEVFDWLGAKIFGEGSTGQRIMGFVGLLVGGAFAGRTEYRGAKWWAENPGEVTAGLRMSPGPIGRGQTGRTFRSVEEDLPRPGRGEEVSIPGLPDGVRAKDVTQRRARMPNYESDLTRTEFESKLVESGWEEVRSADGKARIFSKDGAKYSVRDDAKSTGGPAADFYHPAGNGKNIDMKLRLSGD